MALEQKLAEIDFFSTLSKRELRRVATLVTPVRVPSGRVLAEEGTPGREFMIISRGTATVSRDGHGLAQLGPGDFFGEVALVLGTLRTATVTADTEMVVNALNRREFATLLDESPELTKRILLDAMRRLYKLDESRFN